MPLVLSGTDGVSGVDGTASNPAIEGTDSNTGIFYPAADTVAIGTGGTERLRVDSAGNAGLGVTPSAWGSSWRVSQVGSTGGSVFNFTSNRTYGFTNNGYNDNTNWRYVSTGFSTLYVLGNDGSHAWSTAASGTAGNAITFTQAMTLDASGRLGVNFTPNNLQGMLQVAGSGQSWFRFHDTTAGWNFGAFYKANGTSVLAYIGAGGGAALSGGTVDDFVVRSEGNLLFAAGGNTERARINAGGGFESSSYVKAASYLWAAGSGAGAIGVYLGSAGSDNGRISQTSSGSGTTTTYIGNQAITTSSDIRLKENVSPTERNALGLLQQWEIVDHTWNDPSDQAENNRNSRGVWTGVVAQQVQPITPWLVNKPLEEINEDGSINPWTMDFGYAVPLLVKAIQEQQAMIDEMKAEIAALKAQP